MDLDSAHQVGGTHPFGENNKFEHLSHGEVGKFTPSDQFKFDAPAWFRCSRLILIWTGIHTGVSPEDENQKGLEAHHQEG